MLDLSIYKEINHGMSSYFLKYLNSLAVHII
uniref:Uncharacterized protein n=1 Tax=Arundo donax TaxID=35708 RepID=A0A0A9HML9_ARUDO